MTSKLFIVGNGFDLSHDIKSSYKDFRKFLKNTDKELFDAVEENFNGIDLWSDFEEALAWLDTDTIEDEASNYLVSYGAEDWSDANHHNYQYEIQRRIEIVTVQLKDKFTEWVLQLENNWHSYSSVVPLSQNETYLTFNYTTTLESLYRVPQSNVLHIHNKIIDKNSVLILGHSRKPKKEDSFNHGADLDSQDVRVTEGNQILDSYFTNTYKSTEIIIAENSNFFASIKFVDKIFVLGHSLSPVDIPYFIEIVKHIDKARVKWVVTYHRETDKDHHLKTLVDIGVDASNIELCKLEDVKAA